MSVLSVMGAGSWGTALTGLWQQAGHRVSVWSRREQNNARLACADAIVLALPAQVIDRVMATVKLPSNTPIIITAKGIDNTTQRFMHEVIASTHPHNPCLILSGPSFADDVARGLPTAVTLAAAHIDTAFAWAKRLSAPQFRIYPSDDLIGVAVGGSLKNVLAIACGVAEGKQLGASARAALTARGFAEITRLGRALGAKPETLMGLSGLGDLMLTCSSPQSRNYSFGVKLGQGVSVTEAMTQSSGVVEGAASARAALQLARRHNLAMPITEAVHAMVENHAKPEDIILQLLSRPIASEL